MKEVFTKLDVDKSGSLIASELEPLFRDL